MVQVSKMIHGYENICKNNHSRTDAKKHTQLFVEPFVNLNRYFLTDIFLKN